VVYQTGKDPEWNSKIFKVSFLDALVSKTTAFTLALGVFYFGFWPTPEGAPEVCVY